MKLWLDDKREAPEGWTHVKTPTQLVSFMLMYEPIEEISLDHDLGLINDETGEEETGYDALMLIVTLIAKGFMDIPPVVTIHSANSVAQHTMAAAVVQAHRLMDARTPPQPS